MISFFLNLPKTILGGLFAIVLYPKNISWNKDKWAIIFIVKGAWPQFGYLKKWRGATIGHVIILNPNAGKDVLEHELIHIEQYNKYPLVLPFLYGIELIQQVYKNNKYELEAYSKTLRRST